jgi:chemotaxis protein CheY-P-specific phosphatase CheC
MEKNIGGAASISAVSNTLALSIKKRFPSISPVVIPNVVNTDIFSFDEKKYLILRILSLYIFPECKL